MSITFKNGGVLIQDESEFPSLSGKELFLDLETTSFDRQIKSLNPWHKCFVLGVCIKVDNSPGYYIPVNHAYGKNINAKAVQSWLIGVMQSCQVWINHNVKYDVQVLHNAFGIKTDMHLICTLDYAKLLDSDRFQHSLDALSRDWLKEDISGYEKALKPYLEKNKDYGWIPIDILGEYGCQDVITNSRLWKYISVNMPTESWGVAATSSEVTACLIEMEQAGMRINPTEVATKELLSLNRMSVIQQEIHEKIGYTISPHINADCYDVLCNNLGLPVLGYTDSGNPSFDKHILSSYKALPGAPRDLLDLMLEYRRLQTFTSVFTTPFRALHINGLLHSSYKQTVRTGRMACSTPNMQQLMPEAKELIVCDEHESIISADYSQIEFRIIAHYIQDQAAIEAYLENPFTDFHEWVAKVCNIHRKPAKTVNFLMGYGGGKAKLVDQLMQVSELVGSILERVESMELPDDKKKALFNSLARQRGEEVYTIYHDTLPGLKRTSRAATNRVYERGYCVNKYGRRRHLAKQAAHRAFNTVCQGTAADLMKERLVALRSYLKTFHSEFALIGVVHDEVIIRGPSDLITDKMLDDICFVLEDVKTDLRVPIRTSLGVSKLNWLAASKSAENRTFDRATHQVG